MQHLHSDEQMTPGLLLPEIREWIPNSPSSEESGSGDVIDLIEQDLMKSGLALPAERPVHRETVRGWLVFALLGYFLVMGLVSFAAKIFADLDDQAMTMLVGGLIAPMLPMFGVAVAYYFSNRQPPS